MTSLQKIQGFGTGHKIGEVMNYLCTNWDKARSNMHEYEVLLEFDRMCEIYSLPKEQFSLGLALQSVDSDWLSDIRFLVAQSLFFPGVDVWY